ncbi:MAG: hypothetical protein K2W99_07470 [Chthoniobacterales bacterium]|nr:hypothetical protein [Chthoniobacterales bacterium]
MNCCVWFLIIAVIALLQPAMSRAEEAELHPPASSVIQPFLAPYQETAPQDPSETQLLGDEFEPYKVELSATKEEATLLPRWVSKGFKIDEKESTIEFFLPAHSEQSKIDTFVLTVVFYDTGDGGPRIEWKGPKNKKTIRLCSGLGITGTPLGLNSRTIQIQTETNGVDLIDGGTLTIRHTGRLRQIVSATLRPGHFLQPPIAVLGKKISPSIIDESLNVIEQEVADGDSSPSLDKNEEKNRNLSTKVLSREIERFEKNENDQEVFSKSMPLTKRPKASLLYTDLQGLDLTSSIEVELNGTLVGTLNTSFFRLDAPELILEKKPIATFELAGWQRAHLFIPPSLWKKHNDFTFTIKRGPNATPTKVHLKNLLLELLY